MRFLIALLLSACAPPVTVIERDEAGRICRVEQPEDSRVEIPGEFIGELRKQEGEDVFDKIIKASIGMDRIRGD